MIAKTLVVSLALVAALSAQGQAINEGAQSISFGGKTIALGNAKRLVVSGRLPERPTVENRRITFPKNGVTVVVDAQNRVSFIQVALPFKGRTRRGIAVGAVGQRVLQAYPALKTIKPGWNMVPGIAFLLKANRVTRIQMATTNRPNVKPTPKPRPVRPPVQPPARPRPTVDPSTIHSTTVIWDRTWEVRQRKQWISAPATTWPVDRGRLLVRVAAGPHVVSVDEKIAGILLANIPSKDLVTPPGFIQSYIRKRGGRGRTWQWAATGRGKIRVQVIWFPSEKATARYMRERPHAEFAHGIIPHVVAPPPPHVHPAPVYEELAPKMQMIWEHTWEAHLGQANWVEGPDRKWAREGVLVLRAWGSSHIDSVLWRSGRKGGGTTLRPGDHILETRILDAKQDPLSALFGGGRRNHHLWVGARGHGRVRVQLWWAPHRAIVEEWCHHHPFAPVLEVPVLVDPRTAPGHVTVMFTGSLSNVRSGHAVPDVDVIVQMRAQPGTVYGGLRTDAHGRFAFDVAVPIGTEVVLRVPGFRTESAGRTFSRNREHMVWDARVQ
ncbi:MAG: hypothetical protein CMJ83_04100 [Planctomycetes bacterium]|nr:hypothetical protein [Planctomycetota bacterium]